MKLLLIITVLATSLMSYAIDAELILRNAMEDSQKASFSAELTNPFPEESIQVIVLPRTENWRFYRKTDGDVANLRLDMYDSNGNIQLSYLQNASGSYGTDNKSWSAKIFNVPYLWFPEAIYAEIHPEEWADSSFEVTENTLNGRDTYEVMVKLVYDEDAMKKKFPLFSNKKELILKNRTFARKFIIDKATNLIISRQHYNHFGELLCTWAFDEVDYEADVSDSLFKTPKDIECEFLDWKSFAAKKLAQAWNYSSPDKTNFLMIYNIIYVLLAIIVLIILALLAFKIREKARQK